MAVIEIKSAFVEEQVGSPVFVLKIAEPHSKQDEQGNWQTVARTFFDVKVSRDSGIDLSQFGKGDRVRVIGNQRTEVREHQGKKFYSLVVWADTIEAAQSQNAGFGGGSQCQWGNSAPAGSGAPQGGFTDDAEQPF